MLEFILKRYLGFFFFIIFYEQEGLSSGAAFYGASCSIVARLYWVIFYESHSFIQPNKTFFGQIGHEPSAELGPGDLRMNNT